MKSNHIISNAVLCLGLILLPQAGLADVLEVSPTATAVLDADGAGVTRVLVQFDLTGMRDGAGREIHAAHLNWDLGPLAGDRASFRLQELSEAWSPAQVSSATLVRTLQDSEKVWDLESMDLERIGGLVRFNVGDLVAKWLYEPQQNFGVVVATQDLGPADLVRGLSAMRLQVRYGFSGLR